MCARPVLRVLRTETQCRLEVSPLQGIYGQGDRAARICKHVPSVSLLCCSLCFRVTRARGAAREDQRSNGRLVNKRRQAREAGWGAWAEVVDRATAVLCPCPPLPALPHLPVCVGLKPRPAERGWLWSLIRATPHSPVRKLSLFAVLGTQSRNFTPCVHQPSFTSFLSPSQEAQAH